MINFLDLQRFKKGLKPVTTTEIFSKPGEWHPEGLFSESIFGPEESVERKSAFSYIELNAKVIHPTAVTILYRLDQKIELFLSTQESFSLNDQGRLVVDPDGVTGINEFIKILPKIKFSNPTGDREKFINKVKDAYKDKTLTIDTLPVIPPGQRRMYQDADGRWISDPINEYYISILRKSIQMKSSAKSGALFDLLNYELQKAIIDHDQFIRKVIQKKRGLIRSQLLGKRTDFSGRAVITTGPDLKVNEIGIPLMLAVTIFEPFLIHYLLYSKAADQKKLNEEIKKFLNLELSVDTVRNVFKAISRGDKIPETLYRMVFDAAVAVSMNRAVLAKRDPNIQPKSVRAFKPIIVGGTTIQLSTLQVGGFNADFDGDQMAIFHPITDEAQEEIKLKMMRTETGEDSNATSFEISKEMAAGIFAITKDVRRTTPAIAVTQKDLDAANDPYVPVVYKGKNTTMGKAIFNATFPQGFPWQDKQMNKGDVNKLIPIIIRQYGDQAAIETFSKLKSIGFKFATLMSPTFTLDDLELPPQILEIKQKLKTASIEEADVLLKKAEDLLKEHLKGTGIYDLAESGSAKGWGQPRQILVAKGLVSDSKGEVLPPIAGSFTDGLTNTEYFAQSSGARRGIIDRVLNTADTGYLARQLAYVLNSVEISRTIRDCKVEKYLNLRLTSDLMKRLTGRYILKEGKITEFFVADHKVGDSIQLRSPIYCQTPKICHTCYGKLMYRHRTPYAGVLASQTIGEAGTQTIMRTFHTGGAVKIIQKNIIDDIIENDPFIKKPALSKLLKQEGSVLSALKPCVLTLNADDYPIKGDFYFDEDETELYAKALVSRIDFEEYVFNLILDYPVRIKADNFVTEGKKIYRFKFDANSTVLETTRETDDTKKQIQYARRLIGGKEIYKGTDHLYRKFYKIYAPLRDTDSVHFEVLLSQVLRDKANPSYPARLGKTWDPIMMNIKAAVFKTSFIQGLAFENIAEAIRTGLITDEPVEPSILEKLMTGELAQERKRR
jgi:DNA-directed RNA polymerase beta' subunit